MKNKKLIIIISIIIVIITIIITTTLIIINNIDNNSDDNIAKDDIKKIEKEIQNVYSDATLFASADKKSLIIELKNYQTKDNDVRISNILNVINNNKKSRLNDYQELAIISYIISDNDKDALINRTVYNLSDLSKKEARSYIDFNEYTQLYDTYNEAMNSYTDLFMSIGR